MRNAVIASVSVHVAMLAALLVEQLLMRPGPPRPQPYAQVELVQQDTPSVGRSKPAPSLPSPAAPAAPAADAAAVPPAENPPDPPKTRDALAPPQPPPPAPTKPAPKQAAARPAVQAAPPPSPPVRLDEQGDPGTGLVTGDGVIPARPEDAINTPPAYPKEASQRGEEGLVSMLIHIAPDGRAASVDIVTSSGFARLDEAARKAVLAWHFRPAERNGARVASVLPFNVHYLLPKPGDPLWSGSTE